jgi:hypothetical protein
MAPFTLPAETTFASSLTLLEPGFHVEKILPTFLHRIDDDNDSG